MFALEVRTAAFIASVVAALTTLGMWTLWLRDRRPALASWAQGYGLITGATLLLSLRSFIPDLASIVVANALLLGGFLLLLEGVQRFLERPSIRKPGQALLGATVVALSLLTWIWPSVSARIFLINGALLVIAVATAWSLWRGATPETRSSHLISIVIFALIAVADLGRVVAIALQPPPPELMSGGSVHGAAFLLLIFGVVGTMIGFSNMHADRLVLQLHALARTDELTGILNRRSLEEIAAIEVERAARATAPLWVLMLDVDNFSEVNEKLGHPGGDRVLKRLAQGFRQSLRSYDVIGRYGGDEFCVLLPESGSITARGVADRLRLSATQAGLPECKVTLSAGLAPLRKGEGFALALREADDALYEAKRAGRDRVVMREHPRIPAT